MMNDTKLVAQHIQLRFYRTQSLLSRLEMTFDMVDEAKKQTQNWLRRKFPHFSETEIKIEFIRRYYGHELGEEAIAKITTKIREYEQLTNP
jgi:hypothetical protein